MYEMFIKLGLKEISDTFGIIGVANEIDRASGVVDLGNQMIDYGKHGNKLIIATSDGRRIDANVVISKRKEKDNRNNDVERFYHEVSADYYLKKGDKIRIYNEFVLDGGYESFENIQRHDLMKGLRTSYIDKDGKEVATFNIGLDKVCLKDNNLIYEFTNDGIKYKNKLVSLDGNGLLTVNGNPVPSKEDLESFDYNKEYDKLFELINNNEGLHKFTAEALLEAPRKLSARNREIKNYKDYYSNEIDNVREAISLRNRMIEGMEKEIIKPEELELVNRDARKELIVNRKVKKL